MKLCFFAYDHKLILLIMSFSKSFTWTSSFRSRHTVKFWQGQEKNISICFKYYVYSHRAYVY